MERDPTTAAELHALVAQWPEEARPKDLDYDPPRPTTPAHIPWEWWVYARSEKCGGFHARTPISQAHAIDLHVASAHKYLIEGGWSVVCSKSRDGMYRVSNLNHSMVFIAPTLFLATHSAILSTQKGAVHE